MHHLEGILLTYCVHNVIVKSCGKQNNSSFSTIYLVYLKYNILLRNILEGKNQKKSQNKTKRKLCE